MIRRKGRLLIKRAHIQVLAGRGASKRFTKISEPLALVLLLVMVIDQVVCAAKIIEPMLVTGRGFFSLSRLATATGSSSLLVWHPPGGSPRLGVFDARQVLCKAADI